MKTVNLAASFERFSDYWSPKIVGELNGQYVKLAKLKGQFVWHDHKDEDELFLVIKGELRILFEDGECTLRAGEFAIVPRGVRHLPIANEEAQVLLFEPKGTNSTGETTDPRSTEGVWL